MQAIIGKSRVSLLLINKRQSIQVAKCTSIAKIEKEFIPPPPLPGNLKTLVLKPNFYKESSEKNKEIAFNVFKSASEKKLLDPFKQHYSEQIEHLKQLKKEKRQFLNTLVIPARYAKREYRREIKEQTEILKNERDVENLLGLEKFNTPEAQREAYLYQFRQRLKNPDSVQVSSNYGPKDTASSSSSSIKGKKSEGGVKGAVGEGGVIEEGINEEDNEEVGSIEEEAEESYSIPKEIGDEGYYPSIEEVKERTYWDDATEYDKTLAEAGINGFGTTNQSQDNKKYGLYLDSKKSGYQHALSSIDREELKLNPNMFNETKVKDTMFATPLDSHNPTEYSDTTYTDLDAEVARVEIEQEDISEDKLYWYMGIKLARHNLHVPPPPSTFELVADQLIAKIEESQSQDVKDFYTSILKKHLSSAYSHQNKLVFTTHKWFPSKPSPIMERKVLLSLKVSSLGLPSSVKDRLVAMVENRYNPETDILTLVGDDLPSKSQNKHLVKKTLEALLHEAWKAHDAYVPLEMVPPPIDLTDNSFLNETPENYTIIHVTP